MSDHDSKGHSFFALWPVFTIGIRDSMNPCGIAAALILILYLARAGRTQKRIFFLGALFIVSAAITHFLLTLGAGDPVLTLPAVFHVIRAAYLLVAAVFLILGILNIVDWWRYKRCSDEGCFNLALPVFFQDGGENRVTGRTRKILSALKFIFLAVFAGIVMTFMGSVYPQDEYVFILFSFLMAGGGRGFAFRSFLLYSLGEVLPLLIAWLVILGLARKGKKSPKVILYYKGISSALFLSAGIGLGYLFLAIIT